MTREEFEDIAQETFDHLPPELRDKIDNVQIVVEDLPSDEIVKEMRVNRFSLLGLYRGVPLGYRGTWYGATPTVPDTIFLFQKNIESQSNSGEELRRRIAEVLLHELGHYFGMNEREVRQALKGFV